MKQKSSRRTVLAAALAVAGVFGLFTSPAFADVHVSQNGATLTVTAPSTLAGKGLVLQTDAESSGTWTTKANIVGAVPAAGGSYTVDLAALGIANGTPCRIASATIYNRLDMLQMTTTQTYVDTGIIGSDIYGIRFGYYPTGKSGTGTTDFYYAIGCGKDNKNGDYDRGAFAVCEAATTELGSAVRYYYRGTKYDPKKSMSTSEINEFAFTNGVFTLNNELVKSGLGSNSVSTNQVRRMFVGKSQHASGYMEYGWWSHVSFDDASGNKILDYIPVQRGDGTVGFWNSVGDGAFVTSSGTGSFSAGAQTGESFTKDEEILLTFTANRQLAYSSADGAVTISIPAGLAGESIIIAWDSEDKGDDLAAWTHSATLTDSATAGTITTRLGKLGIRNGDCARIFAANVYKPLDLLHATAKTSYIDTGIKDSDVYTVRIKFMPTGQSSNYGNAIGTGEGTDRPGFVVASSGDNTPSNFYKILWAIQGAKPSNRHTITANEMAELEFVDCKCTWNGTTYTSSKTGAVGLTGDNMYVGRSSKNDNTMYADWGYVKFGDKDDNAIFDAIPVQRASDNTVGFYDRATLTFMPSSGSTAFTAGTVTNDTPVVAANASSATWKVTDIQGLMIIFK